MVTVLRLHDGANEIRCNAVCTKLDVKNNIKK